MLAITHEIYKSFVQGFEVRGVFLDISKAFDKILHEDLLLKLKQNGIYGNFLKLLCNFFSCQKQQVVLNGQHSSWDNLTAGDPQGSILGVLLRLGETHNALQLPMFLFFFSFSFFCQCYPEYWRIRGKKLFYRPPES